MKSRSREIGRLNPRIALEFDRYTGSSITEEPVKWRSNRTILNTNLVAFEASRDLIRRLSAIESGPWGPSQ